MYVELKGQFIIVIGDLHGDFSIAIKILKHANLIDENHEWIGGKNMLVQTGDLFDRGIQVRKLLDLFMRLQKEAKKAGGDVINILGNHELIQYQYKIHPWTYFKMFINDLDTFADNEEKRIKLLSKDGYYGKWLTNLPVAVIESKTKTVFVHGGITSDWASQGIIKINQSMTKLLNSPNPNFDNPLLYEKGPLWYRGYLQNKNLKLRNQELKKALKLLDADRMVVGHTTLWDYDAPVCFGNNNQEECLWDSPLIAVDLGMSSAYGVKNRHGYIKINNNNKSVESISFK